MKKQYCIQCGRELEKKEIYPYYDIDTGERKNDWYWYCPKKKWYNTHTSFKSDFNGSTYAYEI